MTAEIKLPARVYEHNLSDYVCQIGNGNQSSTICLDFQDVAYYTPAAILVLVMKIKKWLEAGKHVSIKNHDQCSAYRYLQRIDFFHTCGLQLAEDFTRRDATGRFVSIREIGYDVGKLSSDIATCLSPELAESENLDERGPFDCVVYAISELSRNASQHSHGKAYAAAQYADATDFIRVAIADTGIGVKESFSFTGSGFWREGMTDLDAINIALEPEVSSRSHLSGWGEAENAGVGLTLLHSLASKLEGKFILASYMGYFSLYEQHLISEETSLEGTLCAFTFGRRKLRNFNDVLYECKQDLGLIKDISTYERLFE